MSQKKEKAKRANQQNTENVIPVDQVLQMQFAKVGQLQFQMDIMRQQMISLENENKELNEENQKLKNKVKKK